MKNQRHNVTQDTQTTQKMNTSSISVLTFYKNSVILCNFIQYHIGLRIKIWYTINRVKIYQDTVGGLSVAGYI